MKCVALLRGINVGGNSRVEMPRLKKLFEDLGCRDVVTYINSGNVVFTDNRKSSELVELIESEIEKVFELKVPVVVRDEENIKELCKRIPQEWTNDDKLKSDVMFLWDEINNEDILGKVKINPQIENVLYFDGALVWSIGRQNVTKGGGIKLIKTDLYKHMTVRNINTVRKLNELLQK